MGLLIRSLRSADINNDQHFHPDTLRSSSDTRSQSRKLSIEETRGWIHRQYTSVCIPRSLCHVDHHVQLRAERLFPQRYVSNVDLYLAIEYANIRFNKTIKGAMQSKNQMASGQGIRWLIKSPTIIHVCVTRPAVIFVSVVYKNTFTLLAFTQSVDNSIYLSSVRMIYYYIIYAVPSLTLRRVL